MGGSTARSRDHSATSGIGLRTAEIFVRWRAQSPSSPGARMAEGLRRWPGSSVANGHLPQTDVQQEDQMQADRGSGSKNA